MCISYRCASYRRASDRRASLKDRRCVLMSLVTSEYDGIISSASTTNSISRPRGYLYRPTRLVVVIEISVLSISKLGSYKTC
jgi:hypothetical protein